MKTVTFGVCLYSWLGGRNTTSRRAPNAPRSGHPYHMCNRTLRCQNSPFMPVGASSRDKICRTDGPKPAQMRAKKAQVIKPGWNASRAQLRASIVAIYTKVTTQHFNSAIGALRQPLQPPPNPRQRRLPLGPQFHAKKKPPFRPDDHLSGHPRRPYSASVALMIIVNARTSKRSLQRREETD